MAQIFWLVKEMEEVFSRKLAVKMEALKQTEAQLNREIIEMMRAVEREKESHHELQDRFLKEKKVLKHLGFS